MTIYPNSTNLQQNFLVTLARQNKTNVCDYEFRKKIHKNKYFVHAHESFASGVLGKSS